MNNILAFLSKYHRLFIFFLLESFSIYLVVHFNKTQGATYMTWRHELSGRVSSVYQDINYYFHLKKTNDSLQAENARLRGMLTQSLHGDTSHSVAVDDTTYHQKYSYIPGMVVNNSVTFPNNYLTLSVGSKKGVKPQQAVICPSGIVGIVNSVSSHFSSVMSVLNTNFAVSAMISEMNEIGSVVWDRENPELVIMKGVPSHIRIKKGMHVVTSPYSDIFPQGINIGVISAITVKPGEAHYTIYVKLGSDMRNITQVYIVSNLMKEEQQNVEEGRDEK